MNPGLEGRLAATQTLYAGLQLIMPGEIAATHRHTPSAIRLIVEGTGAYTTVSGERTLMEPGDFVTTPNWTWHDHGNTSDQPMMWLDGIDLPLVMSLNTMFYQDFVPKGAVQPVVRSAGDSDWRYNRGLRPHTDSFSGQYSPVLNYRYQDVRQTLDTLARAGDGSSEEEGILLDYVNPTTGGPPLPTMAAHVQRLPLDQPTRAVRDTASHVYHVIEGRGCSTVGGVQLDWQQGDTFCVPTWAWREHQSLGDKPAVLFSYDDSPVQQAMALYRRQVRD
jgi:gentisate 1,2-dioxygenase